MLRDRAGEQGTQARRDAPGDNCGANRGDQCATRGGDGPCAGEATDRERYRDRRGLTLGSGMRRNEIGQFGCRVVLDCFRRSTEGIGHARMFGVHSQHGDRGTSHAGQP